MHSINERENIFWVFQFLHVQPNPRFLGYRIHLLLFFAVPCGAGQVANKAKKSRQPALWHASALRQSVEKMKVHDGQK